MSDKVRWGVLGVAKIATEKVIPAMQLRPLVRGRGDCVARPARRARGGRRAGIGERATDRTRRCWPIPNVDAIYNPLPNHLHVPWTTGGRGGKHVLCEKPIGLSAAEARSSSQRATGRA